MANETPSGGGTSAKSGPGRPAFLCGTPTASCSGGPARTSKALGIALKPGARCHGTCGEAFDCRARYLQSQGYEKLCAREFRQPDPVTTLHCPTCRLLLPHVPGVTCPDHPDQRPVAVAGNPVTVLTKRSRFGARLRKGKNGHMPPRRKGASGTSGAVSML